MSSGKKLIMVSVLCIGVMAGSLPLPAEAAKKTATPTLSGTDTYGWTANQRQYSRRVHFEIPGIRKGETINVHYKLKPRKVKKIQGSMKRDVKVNVIAGAKGSAVDVVNVPSPLKGPDTFYYEFQFRVKRPGHDWSHWSKVWTSF